LDARVHHRGRAVRLAAVVAVLAAVMVAGLAPVPAGAADGDGLEKIEHIVIIMQENRTFDQYFGTFPGAEGFPTDAAGNITVCVPNPYTPGTCVKPEHDPRERQIGGPHSYRAHVTSVNGGLMDGFVQAFQDASKPCPKSVKYHESSWCARTRENPLNVMGYKIEEDIPNYWRYAREFVLQDHMFAPSHSWSIPAHLYMVSGWSAKCQSKDPLSCENAGDDPDAPVSWKQARWRKLNPDADPEDMPDFSAPVYAWTDITHLLHKHDVSWGYYVFAGKEPDCDEVEGPITCKPNLQHARTSNIWNPLPYFTTVKENGQLKNIQPMKRFDRALRRDELPSVSWLIPNGAVSEHPRSKVSDGQAWVTRTVNNIMQSAAWENTAIFVSWDDWGGFYDHMVPPVVDENGYGIRVPGLVISPYAKKGYIDKQILSHDAYLKFIEDVFLDGQRIDPATNGRPDKRISVREEAPILGDLREAFDFSQPPRPPLILEPYPNQKSRPSEQQAR
jgi:phospholipase C